jgi:hypothetical protein
MGEVLLCFRVFPDKAEQDGFSGVVRETPFPYVIKPFHHGLEHQC